MARYKNLLKLEFKLSVSYYSELRMHNPSHKTMKNTLREETTDMKLNSLDSMILKREEELGDKIKLGNCENVQSVAKKN